jgi:[protein-PII] uridylyltransferase
VRPCAAREPEPTLPHDLSRGADRPALSLRYGDDGATATVVAPDRPGLLAQVAGVLALHRLAVRSAVVATVDGTAVQEWQVEPQFGDRPDIVALREALRRALDGRLDVGARLAARDAAYRPSEPVPPPQVRVVEGAASDAAVLEVRAHDAPGLLHRLAAAVTAAGADIRSARVATWGAEVVDALYLVGPGGRRLRPDEERATVAAVAAALGASR